MSQSVSAGTSGVPKVDPRAPRFGQIITMSGLGLGVLLQDPRIILAIAVILVLAVVTGWRIDIYHLLWVYVMIPVVGEPTDKEAAAPHRFAKLMGAAFSALSGILLYTGFLFDLVLLGIVGYAIAALVAVMAAIGGIGNYCIGCKMYAEVAYFRRLGIL